MFFTTPMGIPKFNSLSMPNNIEITGVRLDTAINVAPGVGWVIDVKNYPPLVG